MSAKMSKTDQPKFNSMRPMLNSGRMLSGLYVTFQIPDIVEIIGKSWDWIWIDFQHSPIDISTGLSIVRTADAAGVYSLARVGKNDFFLIGQALDMGASGVIVPMVDTPEQAKAVVTAAKFPPMGRRSFGSRRLVGTQGLDYADHANSDTVVFVQLESQLAFDNAEAIAAIEGIDGIIFSADDYIREKGLNVVIPRPPELGLKEKKAIIAAAKKHGKIGGCFCDNPDALKTSLEMGYRLIITAEEDVLILDAAAHTKKWVSEITEQTGV